MGLTSACCNHRKLSVSKTSVFENLVQNISVLFMPLLTLLEVLNGDQHKPLLRLQCTASTALMSVVKKESIHSSFFCNSF